MTTYNTGNPVGSTDPRDLFDNAQNIDEIANSTTKTVQPDRLGVDRKTLKGMGDEFDTFIDNSENQYNAYMSSLGYEYLGDYGAGINVTSASQIVRYASEYWKADGSVLPFTTTGTWATDSDKFTPVGDAALRSEIGSGVRRVDSIAALRLLSGRFANDSAAVLGYYAPGDGGGGPVRVWKTGAPGTYVDNGGSIIVPTGGDGSGAWVWEYSGEVPVQWFGLFASNTATENRAIITTIVASDTENILFPAAGSSYLFDGDILITRDMTLRWEEGAFCRITANTTGGFFSHAGTASVNYINPHLDSDGLLGQNAIGSGFSITVIGGYIKNFLVGGDKTGGKGVNIDGAAGASTRVFGTTFYNCDSPLQYKRDNFYSGLPSSFIASDINIEDCATAIVCWGNDPNNSNQMAGSFTNINIHNCGKGLPFWAGGIIVGSSAQNIKIQANITNDSSYNSGTRIDAIIRGRWANSSFDLTFDAPCVSIHECTPSLLAAGKDDVYWAVGQYASSQGNTYRLNGASAYNYLIRSVDGTYETVPADSHLYAVLTKSPNVGFIENLQDASANESMFFDIYFADRHLSGDLKSIATSYNAASSALLTEGIIPYYKTGTWTPTYKGTSGSAGTLAYATQIGYYSKIGNLVFVTCDLLLSNKGSWTGTIELPAPFTVKSGYTFRGSIEVRSVGYDAGNYLVVEIGTGSLGDFRIRQNSPLSIGGYVNDTMITDTSRFTFSIVYETN